MKSFITTGATCFLIPFLVIYLMVSFYYISFDIAVWSSDGRLIYLMLSSMFGLFSSLFSVIIKGASNV